MPSSPNESARIKYVESFDELAHTPFTGGINALCWRRSLDEDFRVVERELGALRGVNALDDELLERLRRGPARRAVEVMVQDVVRLRELGLEPELNYVREYPRDASDAVVATDVYSFHVDQSPLEVDTWLCTYYGAPSEGVANEEAVAKVYDPQIRAALRRTYGGSEGRGFERYLTEHHYHLHYAPLAGARPWSFGVGNLWRVATSWPGSAVPPCIHRAPSELPGQGRLLLIS